MNANISLLSVKQRENIHEATLSYLEKCGVTVLHQGCREALIKNGATVDGDVVKMPRDMVEAAMKSAPSQFTITARDRAKNVTIGCGMPYAAGPTSGSAFVTAGEEKKYATQEDWANLMKIAHTSDVCKFAYSNIVTPHTDDAVKSLVDQFYEMILMSDKPIISSTQDAFISEMTIDMAKIAVGTKEGEYSCIGVLNSLSPLIWDAHMAGSIYTYALKNEPIVLACCSMGGFTSHINLIDTVLMNNMEIVSGIVIAQVLNPGLPCVYGNVSGASDLKSMNLSLGSPDTLLISKAAIEMSKFYSLPVRSGGGLTDAKMIDAQCGVESATMMLMSMANEVSFGFHALGELEAFNSMSLEKWILDEENYRRAYYMLNRDLGDLTEGILEIVDEIGHGGNYLYEDSTMENFREAFFIPEIADRLMYNPWKERGLSTEAVCKKVWQKRVESYVAPDIDTCIKAKLDEYYSNIKY